MKLKNERFQFIVIISLILINVCFFVLSNLKPILFQQGEIIWQNIFWSMDMTPPSPDTIHLGLRDIDFSKIFMSAQIDYLGFRMRQCSYLIDMLSFKFWQWMELASFHDYTQTLLHITNVILLGVLIYRLTANRSAAVLGSMFFLNSGVAIATLLFPFRSAKLLVMTLFLAAWIILIKEKIKFSEISPLRKTLFTVFLFLALFSDEVAVIIFPIILIFFIVRDGIKGFFNRQTIIYLLLIFSIWLLLIKSFYLIAHNLNDPSSFAHLGGQLKELCSYFLNLKAWIKDTLLAFSLYFLRRNLGYWDFTLPGMMSVISTFTVLYFIFKYKFPASLKNILYTIFGVLTFKAFFLPHPSGIHPYIMPSQTQFPCLLFFGHYYSYVDTVLLAIGLSLLLSQALLRARNAFLVLLIAVTITNYSNIIHADETIRDAINFHKPYWVDPKTGLSILSIKKHLTRLKKDESMYLSFPSGSRPVFTRKFLDEEYGMLFSYPEELSSNQDLTFRDYASILPVMYLRSLANGQTVMSLQNVPTQRPTNSLHELSAVKFFLDVPTNLLFDLEGIKKGDDLFNLEPQMINPYFHKEITTPAASQGIFFFVKGASQITLTTNHQQVNLRQTYGESYQLFYVPFQQTDNDRVNVMLDIDAIILGQTSYLIGPFYGNLPWINR